MSEFDITPNFTSDIPDVGGMVPGEFEAPEAAIDRMVGKPEPTPARLRTPMNPEGRAPRDGMGFRENVSGAFRSGTLAGAIVESAQQEDMASGGAQSARGGFSPAQLAQMPASVRARLSAPDPVVAAQSAQDAEDAVYAQIAYDNSKANLSGASVAGTLVGSLASPESLGGISGLLVKQFKGLASRPILTAGIDAAAVNTLTDPVVQGARMASGAQENFDPAQTAMAPVVGFALGAGVRGALELPSMARERAARQAAGQPEPLVEPTAQPAQAAPVAAAPEAAPVRETPPAATPEPARPVAAAEQPRDPIAAAVDEALPELREAPAPVAREAADDAPGIAEWRTFSETVPDTVSEMSKGLDTDRALSLADETAQAQARLEDSIFGPEGAKEYRNHLRNERSSSNEKADKASAARDRMEASLTPEQRDALFGEGQARDEANPDWWRAVASSLSDVSSQGKEDIGPNLARALRNFPRAADWERMTWDERLSVISAQKVMRDAETLGMTPEQAFKAAEPAIRARYPDPQDADFMTRAMFGAVKAFREGGDTAPAARASEPAALPAPAALLGEAAPKIAPHKVATPDGRAIDVTPIVVEARSLRTSADEGYDAALQPRDRDRAASQAQIREMATALDPQRLGYSAEADRGAPIVGSDGMVESGNGRIMAIRRAYDQGGEAAASYRAWVAEQGVDVSGFREPVLVRQNMTPMTTQERQQFTVAANQASTLSMSAGERAMADARAITPQMLDLVRNPDDLAALGNVDFIKAFVRGLPQTEQGALVRADGTFAAEGLSRIRNAILARAYGDSTVLTRVAEATSDDIKSISNALVSAAPDWAKLRADIDAGLVRADVDFTAELLEAVTRTADLRGKGLKLETFLAQQDAFDRLSAPVEAFMRWFYDGAGRRAASAQTIADKLKFYAQEARKVSAGEGLDLGLAAVSARDIQALASQRGSDRGQAASSPDLFNGGGAGVRASDGAGNADAARPRADNGGEGTGSARTGGGEGGEGRGGVALEGMGSAPRSFSIERTTLEAAFGEDVGGFPMLGLQQYRLDKEVVFNIKEGDAIVGYALVDPPLNNGLATVRAIRSVDEQPFAFGTAATRSLISAVQREFPGVKGVSGFRLSGARDATNASPSQRMSVIWFDKDAKAANAKAESEFLAQERNSALSFFEDERRGSSVARDGDVSPALAEMRSDPASWVIKNKENGAVVMETFDRAKVDALNTAKYEAVPIIDHLASLNKKPASELSFTRGPDGRISGVDLDKSGLELTTTPGGEMLFRKRGAKTPAQPLPPNQVMAGRPLADQATPREGLPVRVVRIEDISAGLVEAFAALGREGRVMPGAQGQYNTRSGVIRVKSITDLDTVAHEVGHSFHLFDAKPDVDAIIKANRKELEPLGAGDKTGDMEAFAELFRLFTINRPFAERSYPNATAALDELLRSKFPGQYTALDELRVAMDDLHRAPSGEVVRADTIQTEPPKFGDGLRKALASDYDPSGRTLYNAFDALYTSVIDKTHPVWKAVENLRAIGKANGKDIDLKPVDDAYILSRMLPGSHGSAGVMLEHGVIPAGAITPEGPSLGSAMEKALGKKWDEKGFADFGAYLTARRMVAEYGRFFNGEIPNPPGKFSLADYQKAVAEFDAANPTFREAADDVYGFLNNHLKRAYDKGLFSKEYYDASISRTDYVPFVRDMADFNDPASVGEGGAPKGLRFSLMKAFKGSQRSVQNPLESIFKRVHDLEFAIAQNDAIGALARLADAAGPGSGAIAERIPSNQLRGQRVDVVEALKAAGKSANIDDADLKALILQAEDQLGDSTWATLFKQEPIAPGREPIVFHWVNGERQALRLADGRFGTELFHALNAMSDVEKNWFASILQISQQILRSGVTKAPDFILTNFIRDQFTATATSGRRYIPFISALRGVVDAVTKTDDAISYAGMGGMAGGAISDAIERAAFGKNVQALEKSGVIRNVMAGDILGAGGALLRTGAKALELSEAGTRMGLYKSYFEQAKGMGFDDLNASTYAAFKATDYIDFRKAGASMGWLRRWVPFLNAALQGTDKEFRAIGDLPVLEAKRARGETLSSIELDRLKDARVAMIRVLSLGAIVGAGLAIKNADEPDYQNAPEFTKRGNFLLKVGDVWVAIPKPFGIVQSVVNAFETAADYSVRKDPSLWGDWLEGSAKGFVPPTNNPLISLVYDLPANYNRFRDSPIVPYYLQGVKPSEQYTIGTSELSKMIGQVTGWSPMKIEYAVSNLGGSSALNLLKASDLLMGSDKPESQVYNWPVARRFVKNLVRGNQATTEFYKLVGDKTGKYEQSENAYKIKIRNGERANAAEFLRALPEDERAWTVLQSFSFDPTVKRLHPMQNAKDRISVIGGMTSQLNFNNLIKDEDLERGNLVRSRRAAAPIALDKSTRAKLIENFQELQFISARNAMITVGAKGTAGLKIIDDSGPLERIKAISPEVHAEYLARAETKKIYEPAATFQAWPEMKSRLVRDGETADLKDLLPAGVKPVRKKPFKVRN